jgi:WD40 repeat protein
MRTVFFGLVLWVSLEPLLGADPKPALRVLRDECFGCHKPGKAKGGLLLTNREKMLVGGDSGVVVTPGKAAESLLYQTLLPEAEDHMPPKKQLTEKEIASVKGWIDSGAIWDATVFDEPPQVKPVKLTPMVPTYAPVLALALSPDGTRLAVARAAHVDLHDLSQPNHPKLQQFMGMDSPVQALAWTKDGKQLLAAGFRRLLSWEVASGKEVGRLEQGLIGTITALVCSSDGTTVFAADGETGGLGFIHRLTLSPMKTVRTWKAHDDNINALALSQDGQFLASGGADKMARLWKAADGSLVTFYEGHTNHVVAVALNHDASQIATAGADREVKVWDVKSRNQDAILGDKKTAFTALYWTPDGKSLAAADEKGAAFIYTELQKHTGAQRSDAAKEKRLVKAPSMLVSMVVTRDSKTAYAGDFSGNVHVWEIASGKETGLIKP